MNLVGPGIRGVVTNHGLDFNQGWLVRPLRDFNRLLNFFQAVPVSNLDVVPTSRFEALLFVFRRAQAQWPI